MTSCQLWTKSKDKDGYGLAWAGNKQHRAHRLAWTRARGPIPAGLCVLHRCDQPACVNVEHLWLGTNADNMADKVAKGRQSRGPSAKHRQRTPRGERVGLAKLTAEQVIDIRAHAANGETQVSLASRFGVVQQNIHNIVHRKTWAHI